MVRPPSPSFSVDLTWFAATGLHFTGTGYKIMYDEVMKVLQASWPEEDPEKLPMVFPHWEVAPKPVRR